MIDFAEALELEEKWIDALFRFRIHFPHEDVRKIRTEDLHRISSDALRLAHSPDSIVESVLPSPLNPGSAYAHYATPLAITDRFILAVGCIRKFLPGNLDRKIHHHFFSNLKEPASIVRNTLGIVSGQRPEQFVPSLNFVAYVLCGSNTIGRIQLFHDIHHQKINILNTDDIFIGERDLEDPIFSNAFVLSDELGLKFLG